MVYLAADHRGFKLKEALKTYLNEIGYQFHDFGAFSYDPEDDYPDIIRPAINQLAKDTKENYAIILGASGQGEAIVANRTPGIRATVYYGGSHEILKLSRQHNNANVLSLGAIFLSEEEAKAAVGIWLSAQFSNEERHIRRIKKIDPTISNF